MTNLTRAERETIILFNEQDDTANICTCNVKLRNRLKTLSQRHECVVWKDGNEIFDEYELPKSLIRVAAPRQVTDEEREKLRERGRLLFERMKKA